MYTKIRDNMPEGFSRAHLYIVMQTPVDVFSIISYELETQLSNGKNNFIRGKWK